jgi:hypothetical protein
MDHHGTALETAAPAAQFAETEEIKLRAKHGALKPVNAFKSSWMLVSHGHRDGVAASHVKQ